MCKEFKCGECPIEYCYCDKVGSKFYAGGYCEDSHETAHQEKQKGHRETGRAYRRRQKKLHDRNLKKKIPYGKSFYYVVGNKDGSERIKCGGKSDCRKFFKNYSNRVVRRKASDTGSAKGGFRKAFDYWWTVL